MDVLEVVGMDVEFGDGSFGPPQAGTDALAATIARAATIRA